MTFAYKKIHSLQGLINNYDIDVELSNKLSNIHSKNVMMIIDDSYKMNEKLSNNKPKWEYLRSVASIIFDLVIITTPSSSHFELAKKSINLGNHLKNI